MMSLRAMINSFRHALRGLGDIAAAEQSFRLQIVVGAAIIVLIFVIDLASWEKVLLVLLVSAVLVLEIVNTIFERIADAVEPRVSPMVREIKDMMAGAVLITAITAAVVGTMILGPHLLALWYTLTSF